MDAIVSGDPNLDVLMNRIVHQGHRPGFTHPIEAILSKVSMPYWCWRENGPAHESPLLVSGFVEFLPQGTISRVST
jgi:hypothetical protein